MQISYDKLWKLLIDNKMKKGDLFRAAKLTNSAIYKLNHNESIELKYIVNICKVFHCDIGDVVELIEDDSADTNTRYKTIDLED